MRHRLSPPPSLIAWLILCYAFLYAPIGFLVAFSFSGSRLVTVWGGFSTRWYRTLWNDAALLDAAWLSLRIAAASATMALIAGTIAGFVLARFGRFRGRGMLEASLAAPLVLPEVITGLSLLLLFVMLERFTGWPAGRGAGTVTIAHAAVSAAYVTVVVRSRLTGTGMELEEAAADLGARPWEVFGLVTLPLAAPALVAGWLLAFTLSLDDVVVASFTSGPGATTLPMMVLSATKLGVTPEIYALAAVILAGVAGVMATGMAVAGRLRR